MILEKDVYMKRLRTTHGRRRLKIKVQVAYSVAEDKAYNREFEAFKGIDNLSQKILITNDEIDYSTSVVRHIKLKDFLRMQDLTV